MAGSARAVLALQRTAGNAAVARVLAGRASRERRLQRAILAVHGKDDDAADRSATEVCVSALATRKTRGRVLSDDAPRGRVLCSTSPRTPSAGRRRRTSCAAITRCMWSPTVGRQRTRGGFAPPVVSPPTALPSCLWSASSPRSSPARSSSWCVRVPRAGWHSVSECGVAADPTVVPHLAVTSAKPVKYLTPRRQGDPGFLGSRTSD